VPTAWLLVSTITAGWQKIFHDNPGIGFLAQVNKYRAAVNAGELIAPAKSMGQMQQVVVNNFVNACLTAVFLAVVLSVLWYSVQAIRAARSQADRTDRETPRVALQPQEART